MKHFSPLCSQWHGQVKQLFTLLLGHQTKVLAMFVLGAIRAESIVVQRVAEELLEESDAKVPERGSNRRHQRINSLSISNLPHRQRPINNLLRQRPLPV